MRFSLLFFKLRDINVKKMNFRTNIEITKTIGMVKEKKECMLIKKNFFPEF